MRWLWLAAGLLLAAPALADMYQDASNAKLPEARANLGGWPTVDARKDLGCKGDGVADDTACITAMVAQTGSPSVYFGPGTYLMGCGPYTFASAPLVSGAGRGITTLKVQPGCTLPATAAGAGNGLFNLSNGTGGGWKDLTIELLGAIDPNHVGGGGIFSPILRYSCQNDFIVDNIAMLNIGDNSLGIFLDANGCPSKNWTIQNSHLHMTAGHPDYVSAAISMGGGTASFDNAHITNNRLENSGMQVSGTNIFVTNNDISGWATGTGIYQVQVISQRHMFLNNILHDSAVTFDINNTPGGGIELDGEHSVFAGNQCRNLGGACVVTYGSYNLIEGNHSKNVGLATPNCGGVPTRCIQTAGAFLQTDNSGPSFPQTPIPPTSNVYQNNVDLGGPQQLYSYYERLINVPHVNTIVRNNYFTGSTVAAYNVSSTSTRVTPSRDEILISALTTIQSAVIANTTYQPGGASLTAINQIVATPVLGTSAVPVGVMRGVVSNPTVAAGFTGTLGAVTGFDAVFSNASAVTVPNLVGYQVETIGNGNAITSGSVINTGYDMQTPSAAAGAGGTVVNNGFRAVLGAGSSATTTNRGIYITGTGGALSTNFAIYSDSTARSYFAGPMTMTALPASAGAGGLYVCVDSVGVLYKKASCP